MKKLLFLLIILFAQQVAIQAKVAKTSTRVAVPKFRIELNAIIRAASGPDGVEPLKHTELVHGVWSCNRELEGFLPTIVYDEFHPAGRLLIKAESVNAAALRNVRLLIQKGMPGYKMADSDKDKTVEMDRTRQSRKVTFKKRDRYQETTITILFNAHQYSSVTMLIECTSLHVAS